MDGEATGGGAEDVTHPPITTAVALGCAAATEEAAANGEGRGAIGRGGTGELDAEEGVGKFRFVSEILDELSGLFF